MTETGTGCGRKSHTKAESPIRTSSLAPRVTSTGQSPRTSGRQGNEIFLIFSVEFLSSLLQALRQMFIVRCQFDERFSYEQIEALARQSLAFLRLSMKLFGSRSAGFHGASLQFVPSCLCLVPIRARFVHAPNGHGSKTQIFGRQRQDLSRLARSDSVVRSGPCGLTEGGAVT